MVNRRGKYGRHTGNTLRMGCVARKKNKKYCGEFGIFVDISGAVTLDERQGIVDDFSTFVDDPEISKMFPTYRGGRWWGMQSSDVCYSMNKHKRWELPSLLKESVSDLERHADSEYRVRVVERELASGISGVGRSTADVTSVTDSKVGIPQKKSKRRHAFASDVIANTKPKKQGRRSRLRRAALEEEEVHDPVDHLPVLTYECCYPRSAEVYPWYNDRQCDQYKCSGKQKSPYTKSLKRTKGQRDKQSSDWHGSYSRANFHNVETFLQDTAEDTEDEAKYDTEQLLEARTELPSTGEVLAALIDMTEARKRKQRRVDRVYGKGCSVPNIASSAAVSVHPKGSAILCSQTTPDTQDLKEDNTSTDIQDNDVKVVEVYEEKPSVQVYLTTDSLNPVKLEGVGGGVEYHEGRCVPRVFRLDLSDLVSSQVREGRNRDVRTAVTVQLLCEVQGDETIIVDENGQTEECCNTRLSLLIGGEDAVDCDKWGDSWEGSVAMTMGDVVCQTVSFLSSQLNNKPSQKDSKAQIKQKVGHSLKVISEICKVNTTAMSPSEIVMSQKDEVKRNHQHAEKTSQKALLQTTCGICWAEVGFGDIPAAFALQSCLHCFCRACWENHVVTKVKQGSTAITCPEYGCSGVVDDTTLMLLLPVRLYRQYRRRVQNVAVDSSDSLHWCKDAKCGKVLSVTFTGKVADPVPVRCECGSMWCTSCGEEPHWPATCQQAREHLQELKDKNLSLLEESTYTALTKKCPTCRHPMEKNGGCPHMVCICGTSFCWTCGQEYGLHRNKDGIFACPVKPYQLEEIELQDAKSKSFYQKAWYKASLEHRKARGQGRLTQTYQQAHRLARKMVLYTDVQLFYKLLEGNHKHTSDNLLSKYMELTGGAADLLMQMHLAAEFTAVLASNVRGRLRRNLILNLWRRMTFIQDCISRILEEERPCPSTVQEKLEVLLHVGKGCLQSLHRLTHQQNQTTSTN